MCVVPASSSTRRGWREMTFTQTFRLTHAGGGTSREAVTEASLAFAEGLSAERYPESRTPTQRGRDSPAAEARPVRAHRGRCSPQISRSRNHDCATESCSVCSRNGDARSIHERRRSTFDCGLRCRVNPAGRGCERGNGGRANEGASVRSALGMCRAGECDRAAPRSPHRRRDHDVKGVSKPVTGARAACVR